MFSNRIPRLRILTMFALLLILSAVAYGFAAANTVPGSGAGDGVPRRRAFQYRDVVAGDRTSDPQPRASRT